MSDAKDTKIINMGTLYECGGCNAASIEIKRLELALTAAEQRVEDERQKHESCRPEIELLGQERHRLKELLGNATLRVEELEAQIQSMHEDAAGADL